MPKLVLCFMKKKIVVHFSLSGSLLSVRQRDIQYSNKNTSNHTYNDIYVAVKAQNLTSSRIGQPFRELSKNIAQSPLNSVFWAFVGQLPKWPDIPGHYPNFDQIKISIRISVGSIDVHMPSPGIALIL